MIPGARQRSGDRTAQYRWQLADAVANVDAPESLPVLGRLLEMDDTAVRLSAARALVGQSSPATAVLLARAVDLDYGKEDGVSRNPEIHAALLHELVGRFPNGSQRQAVLDDSRRLKEPSIALMVFAAREGSKR
ncbi:MAG: HEAT repeat domain-containing protein [Lysobacterales bacterium]